MTITVNDVKTTILESTSATGESDTIVLNPLRYSRWSFKIEVFSSEASCTVSLKSGGMTLVTMELDETNQSYSVPNVYPYPSFVVDVDSLTSCKLTVQVEPQN